MSKRPRLPSEDRIVETLRKSRRGPLKVKELARTLGVPTHAYRDFRAYLRELADGGQLYRVKGQRYALPEKINLVVGILSGTRSGDAFVRPERGGGEVYVPGYARESAMDGDRVVVRIEGKPRGRSPVGRVIKILERAHTTLVGTYRSSRGFGLLTPTDRRLGREVLIPGGDHAGARDGDIVVVRIQSYGSGRLNPTGSVETVLGKPTDTGVDMLAVIHGHGLPLAFPQEVEDAAKSALASLKDDPGAGRIDRTDLHVITIDPADARDHDDALSVTEISDGTVEVGIHIADVTHFIEEGGPLDLEAFARGTSVYLVDRVIPMLPAALSSDACSLLPDLDRFAVSVFAKIDEAGRVREHRFERTTIRSRRKLSYEEAQAILNGPADSEDATAGALQILDRFARVIRVGRKARGAIDFDVPEARVVLGEDGEPLRIERVERLEAHRLIEDYMLLANELVARAAEQRRLPVLYRVHEPPPTDKLNTLRQFLSHLGKGLRRGRIQPRELQDVLARYRGRPEEAMVSKVILRSMSRARYDALNRGHFGLAAEWYCHFTSPIRRYPDLWTHRVLIRCLLDGHPPEERWSGEGVERIAVRSSDRERVAESAERESVDLKKVQYMERHLGDVFDGTISGVTSFGFFVTLDEVFVDGLVHVNSLEDDYYVFQDQAYRLVGERTRRTFRLGDRVTVLVSRVDPVERRIDFVLSRQPVQTV